MTRSSNDEIALVLVLGCILCASSASIAFFALDARSKKQQALVLEAPPPSVPVGGGNASSAAAPGPGPAAAASASGPSLSTWRSPGGSSPGFQIVGPASAPLPTLTLSGSVPSFDTMTEALYQQLFGYVVSSPAVGYSFQRGSDGLLYYIEDNAPNGWLDVIVNLRKSAVALLARVQVAPNGQISRLDDLRLSENEFQSICKVVNQRTVSALASIAPQDTGYAAECTATDSNAPMCGTGCIAVIASKDFTGRKWTQQNITYVLHELSHAAMSAQGEYTGHNLEFFRVQHVLTTAAISLGPSVYNTAWYDWSTTDPAILSNLGSMIGDDAWWAIEKNQIIAQGMHWNGTALEKGKDPVFPTSITGVNITVHSPGA